MEQQNIMDKDNKYGIRELPSVEQVVKAEEKSWGDMSTLFDQDGYSIKKIFMRAGTQSSMEYHVHKKESYYIDKGQLKLGLRRCNTYTCWFNAYAYGYTGYCYYRGKYYR